VNTPRGQRDHFIHPSCRSGWFPRPSGAAVAILLFSFAVVSFQFTSESWWFLVAGGILLFGSFAVGWRCRASIRDDDVDDLRKLYDQRKP